MLERRNAPPSTNDFLRELPDEAMRDVARRRMLRAAALADCRSPDKAVAAGFSLARGLRPVCMEARGARTRAQKVRACRETVVEPYQQPELAIHAILARFHLAGVLADVGEHAESRAHYEAFLKLWSDADRPIRELAVARRMLQRK